MKFPEIQKFFKICMLFFLLLVTGCNLAQRSPTSTAGKLTTTPPATKDPAAVAPTPKLDPATEQALAIYPLFVGSSWVYKYLGYSENMEVVWQVVETVVETSIVDGYFVAELERTAEVLEGNPPSDFLTAPDEGTFWYLVDGSNLYRYESELHTDLSGAWLDLVIPFPANNEAWYPHPDQRSNIEPATVGFRSASDPFRRELPMGGTYNCYNIATRFKDGTAEGTFCETIGYVYQEFNYYNRKFGYRSELVGFSLQ